MSAERGKSRIGSKRSLRSFLRHLPRSGLSLSKEDYEEMSENIAGTNSSADKKARRELLRCPVCPPNKGENAARKPKHGVRKPKHKRKRRA